MEISRAYKVELDPDNKQKTLFRRHLGSSRHVYNWGRALKIDNYHADRFIDNDNVLMVDGVEIKPCLFFERYKKDGTLKKKECMYDHRLSFKFIAKGGSAHLTKYKKEVRWLGDIDSMTSVSSLRDLEKSYDNFFRRLKSGDGKPGFPRFRSRGNHRSFHVNYQSTEIHGKYIKLGKIGLVKIKDDGYLPKCKYNSVTVSTSGGRWYVSVQVDGEIDRISEPGGKIVGIDVGVNTFAVLSDGKRYDHPKPLRMMQRKLRRIQKGMSRSRLKNGGYDKNGKALKGWEPTSNYIKNRDRLSKVHHSIKRIREDFLHKTTIDIINEYDIICVEDLNVKGMTSRKKGIGKRGKGANRAMLDQGWGEFVRQLKYKAKWYGKIILVVDNWFPSTKMCSGCGNVKKEMKITERTYRCEKCGLELDRDLNANHNLMTVAAGLTETLNACRDGSAGSKLQTDIHGHSVIVEACSLSGTTTMKQEPGIPEVST